MRVAGMGGALLPPPSPGGVGVGGEGRVGGGGEVVERGWSGAAAGMAGPGRIGTGVLDLPVIARQQIGAVAVQPAGPAAVQGGGLLAGPAAEAPRLDADHAHGG